jgi:phosphatidylglycerophosphate synthase
MNNTALQGKAGNWLLKNAEDKLKKYLVPCVPAWLETYHLTWMTLAWSALIVLFFYLGRDQYLYYWFVPVFVALQYLTDVLDGAVGRARDTGLIKWGYYADHFLDFVFMCSIVTGYALVTGFSPWIFFILALASGAMIHTFLLVSTNQEFQLSFMRLGPTEGRLLFIIAHLILVYRGINEVELLLPYVAGIAALFLIYIFLATQKKLWRKDMEIKHGL